MPDGLDSQLGPTWPNGVEVSFGQWQKLSLARGFMRDEPLLLVLDEPTAALDAETEHALFERYASAAKRTDTDDTAAVNGRITLLVSHRFSTVRMADLIVVMDGARVVEVGSHEELMAVGGQYAELYAIQESGLPLTWSALWSKTYCRSPPTSKVLPHRWAAVSASTGEVRHGRAR